MNIHSKHALKIWISAVLLTGLSGCNVEPVRGNGDTSSGTPSTQQPDPDDGSPSQPNTGQTPDPTPDPVPPHKPDPTPDPTPDPAPNPEPDPITAITLSGVVLGDRGQQYQVQLSDGQSVLEVKTTENGAYQFDLTLRQWLQQNPLTLTATDKDDRQQVFSQSLPTIDQILLLDGDRNQLIDDLELLPLALSPAPLAFDAVARQLTGKTSLTTSEKTAAKIQMASDVTLNQALVRDLSQLLAETQAKPADSASAALPLLGLTQSQLVTQLVRDKATSPSITVTELYLKLAEKRNITLGETVESQLNAALEKGTKLNTLSGEYRWQESFYPEYTLTLSGQFPAELQHARLSVLIGAKPNDDTRGEYYYKPERPHRVIPLTLEDSEGRHSKRLDVSGQQTYKVTLRLHDTASAIQQCSPGLTGESWAGNITDDNLQDLLTLQIVDQTSNVELRSVLGPFCELLARDSNKDGILESHEYSRTDVGYISTAQEVLLKKVTLASYGAFIDWKPLSIAAIDELLAGFPRQQTELLAAFAALQARQSLFGETIDLIENAGFYQDLLKLVNINMQAEYSIVSNNNLIPALNILQSQVGENSGLSDLLIQYPDRNVSHIIKAATGLLGDSVPDAAYFHNQPPPGRWVQVYPNSHLAPICQSSGQLSYDQVTGIALVGQGVDPKTGKHWLTLDWPAQDYVSEYTLAWDTANFSTVDTASHKARTTHTRATIRGLEKWQAYQIRIGTPSGSLSAVIHYTPGKTVLNDTRITKGILGDDSTRGRDTQNQCDPVSGLAFNSNRDGELGARYLKLDAQGERLPRQDLAWKQLKFSCVADANTGLIWETKSATDLENPTLQDDLYYFAMDGAAHAVPFNGTCYNPDSGKLVSERSQCTAANQLAWVNASNLCGLDNWRLPTQAELYGLMNLQGDQAIALDTNYFPNNQGLKTTYFNWKDDQGKTHYESIYRSFWTADHHPLAEKSMTRTVRMLTQRSNDMTANQEPHLIMLVSDGFQAP
ncbi:DUF1566 domain-containing protein [Photobacterium sp. 1_MG-2023]|uniref:Lcl domain-containing protein n=1 Tax=Photobacterium sp. 1_MG-2023 TaxID=3062646 RepID=UPI0026E1E688|nr:DUF1566 domain-containing protein [Photobacterium sp. 1_MG-2023]MDO6708224.1 DUF1566 domain-containing protein [Photobacterium sp. 1_MG-2023]